MMYSIPIVTHFAGQNAQADTIGDGGFCVRNSNEYAKALLWLSEKNNREKIGDHAKNYAMKHYEQNIVGSQIMNFYMKMASLKGF